MLFRGFLPLCKGYSQHILIPADRMIKLHVNTTLTYLLEDDKELLISLK